MMLRLLVQIILLLLVAVGPMQAEDNKAPPRSSTPNPEDLEVIAIMEILKLMDLAKEMEMVKEMEHLAEESKNDRTSD